MNYTEFLSLTPRQAARLAPRYVLSSVSWARRFVCADDRADTSKQLGKPPSVFFQLCVGQEGFFIQTTVLTLKLHVFGTSKQILC